MGPSDHKTKSRHSYWRRRKFLKGLCKLYCTFIEEYSLLKILNGFYLLPVALKRLCHEMNLQLFIYPTDLGLGIGNSRSWFYNFILTPQNIKSKKLTTFVFFICWRICKCVATTELHYFSTTTWVSCRRQFTRAEKRTLLRNYVSDDS